MKKFIKITIFYLQRLVKSYQLRNYICKIQCLLKGRIIIKGESNYIKQIDEIEIINYFKSKGYVEIPSKIPPKLIKIIKDKVKIYNLYDPFNKELGHFSLQNIPKNTHVANYRREDLINVPEILQLANDPGILRIVQDYLGCKPTISNVNMWWSIAGKENAENAQLFHRDVDDIKFCKLFIYLTDVGLKDGPHTYVSESAGTNKLTAIRRYDDNEIEKNFGKENILQFNRAMGSCFIVDTYGFHKGMLPEENCRLLLQIQYSINPIGIESYAPQSITTQFNSYINRKLVLN